MAYTLTQAAKLSTDVLQAGVIETFARTSPVLEQIPFMTIAGNSYQYNQEAELPSVEYRNINEGYVANEGTFNRKSEGLVMLGGDVDVDKFIVRTLGNVNDQRAIQTNMKVKAVAKQFTKDFFKGNGDGTVHGDGTAELKGLDARMTENNQTAVEANEDLKLKHLHELLDKVEGGADVIYMTKATRRELQGLLEGQQHYIQVGKDEFGRTIELFGDVSIRTVEDGVIEKGEIYAVKFGAQEAVSGLTNGGVMVDDLGEIDEKPVYRTRIEFYCGIADFHPKSFAKMTGGVLASGDGSGEEGTP